MLRPVLVLIAVLALSIPGAGSPASLEPLGEAVGLTEAGSGNLLYRTDEHGRFAPAPVLHTEVEIAVRGLLAETVVRQRFANPTSGWLEGVYVFPLPAGSAVHAMRLVVGERIIEGEIREREQARRTYQQARSEGRKASLVEQERPNLFTTSVANVGPGEAVEVEIRYQETLRWDRGVVELAFPMVIGPRYVPGVVADGSAQGTGWERPATLVPDAGRITPPVRHPSAGPANPVQLRVELDPGFELADLVSPYHPIDVERRGDGLLLVSLAAGPVPADRDFVLRWSLARGSEPRAAVFAERHGGATYALVMLVPPAEELVERGRLARETVLVIDTSGSMQGASIVQARAALEHALDRLHPEDLFNVIRFSNRFERLFPDSRPASPVHLDRAREWVQRLQAGGGTEMAPALAAALEEGELTAPVRQVVFVTDGCVGNEDHLFGLIEGRLGRTRLFTVGIGSAPNRHFMERAASFGRGTFTFIGATGEVARAMDALFAKLEDPVLADLELGWPDATAEAWPSRLPDLYSGEPLVVAARLGNASGELVLTGVRADRGFEHRLPLGLRESRAGIHRLWARRKIAALEEERARGVPESEVRAAALAVALDHGLVCRYTSLVAVDVTPTRSADDGLRTAAAPTNLPHGWRWEGVFGGMPRTGSGWRLRMLLALILAGLGATAALRVRS